MTLQELNALLGKEVYTFVKSGSHTASINWTIVDHKNIYGKDQWLLSPISGKGNCWFETSSVHAQDGTNLWEV